MSDGLLGMIVGAIVGLGLALLVHRRRRRRRVNHTPVSDQWLSDHRSYPTYPKDGDHR